MRFNPPLLNAIAGSTLGLIVWRLDAPASLALLLPMIWLNASSRLAGVGAVMGYYLAGAFDVLDAAQMFFGQSPFIGLAAWLCQAALLTLPWLLLWAPSGGTDRAWRVVLALLSTIVPPFGLFNWLSPVLAAGELFPGAGLWGLPITVLLPTILATWSGRNRVLGRQVLLLGFITAVALQIMSVTKPRLEAPTGWIGLNTTMGLLPPGDRTAQFQRAEAVRHTVAELTPHSVAILPESIVGRWRPAVHYWLGATRSEGIVLIGADVPAPEGGYQNALVDQRTGRIIATARIPMPISLWKPWAPAESAQASPWGPGVTQIAGHQVAISVCYEDFLLWPQLLSLSQRPDVLISVANNWFVRTGSHASVIQARSVGLTARLFGLPLVRAVNTTLFSGR